MNTIEQAREAAAGMRSGVMTLNQIRHVWPTAIDALIAENAALLIANRDCVDWFENLKVDYDKVQAELASRKGQEPVGHLTLDGDFIQNQRWYMQFGVVPKGKALYLAAGAQPTIRDFRTVQDHIKTVDIVGWRWVATCGSGAYQLTDYEPMRGYSYKSPVYEVPPVQAQERKPLTDDQITEVWRELREQKGDWSDLDFARAIEAKIKEQT